jgi:CelD/BcsL family acetyltransferase involved in cellulose biosynthesis
MMTTPAIAIHDLSIADPAVTALLNDDPRVGVFSSPPWFEVLADTYGFDIRASVIRHGDAVVGVLPYCHLRDIRGERIVSVPFSDFCDPLVDTVDDWHALATPLLDRGAPITLRLVHNTLALDDARFRTQASHVWMGMDIAGTPDELFAAAGRNARETITRSMKKGLTTRITTSAADVTTFWNMQIVIRKSKHRLLAQPEAFFQNLRDRFDADGQFVLVLAEEDGAVVAGSMFLVWGDTLFYKYNASVTSAFGANDLVLWTAIRYAAEKGLKLADFGLSEAEHEGLIKFKRKWATQEKPLYWLRANDETPTPVNVQAAPVGGVLGELTELLTRDNVPDEVSAAVGTLLYRYFA